MEKRFPARGQNGSARDGLHYYVAKKLGAMIVSYDKDFDGLDVKRLEPQDLLGRGGS